MERDLPKNRESKLVSSRKMQAMASIASVKAITCIPGHCNPGVASPHDVIVELRKRDYSISRELKKGSSLGPTDVRQILAAENLLLCCARLDEERPIGVGPTIEALADVRNFVLSRREFTSRVDGFFPQRGDLLSGRIQIPPDSEARR